jgi:hypothetical protein
MFSGEGSATYDGGIKLHKVGDGWDDLSAGVGKFTGAIDGAVSTLARMGSMAAIGAATAGIAGISPS